MTDGAGAELLWLETLQQLTARAAHELKGALNGVSVNLEVVRGRSAQADQPASAVERFAVAAATQLDVVIEMNEALLALARRPRDPADVTAAVRQVAGLLGPVASAARAELAVTSSVDGLASSSRAPAVVVRTVLARSVMALMDAGGGRVQLGSSDAGTIVELVGSQEAVVLDPRVAALAADAGIGIRAAGAALTLTFPVAAPDPVPAGTPTHETA